MYTKSSKTLSESNIIGSSVVYGYVVPCGGFISFKRSDLVRFRIRVRFRVRVSIRVRVSFRFRIRVAD
jgi:hypothetical protein